MNSEEADDGAGRERDVRVVHAAVDKGVEMVQGMNSSKPERWTLRLMATDRGFADCIDEPA